MMNKEQIEEQIDRLRSFERVLHKRYLKHSCDETLSDLMLYKKKIDSWKRLYEKARHKPIIIREGEPKPFEPRKKKATLSEILAAANIPVVKGDNEFGDAANARDTNTQEKCSRRARRCVLTVRSLQVSLIRQTNSSSSKKRIETENLNGLGLNGRSNHEIRI